jgi:hypothetical protein
VSGWTVVVLLVACATSARGAGAPEVTARATVGEQTAVVVEVRNTGDDTISKVVPVVVYQGQEVRGDHSAAMPPGTRATWTFTLPLPAEPGSIPAVVDVHYEDALGRQAVPAVATVSTPGLLPVPEVHGTLTAAPVTRFSQAQLVLDNPTPSPLHGRVVVLLPAGLSTEPTSQAAEVPPDGRRAIPLVLQNDGATPGAAVPVIALYEYGMAGRRHLTVASATVSIVGGGPAIPPLVIGTGALAAALALCGLAWRRAAAKRHRAA